LPCIYVNYRCTSVPDLRAVTPPRVGYVLYTWAAWGQSRSSLVARRLDEHSWFEGPWVGSSVVVGAAGVHQKDR